MDRIDIVVCEVFNVKPERLIMHDRKGNIVYARFATIYLHYQQGMQHINLAVMYKRSVSAINYSIITAKDNIKYNKRFAQQINVITNLIHHNRAEYKPQLLMVGLTVWTRPDSHGNSLQGAVRGITDSHFYVEFTSEASRFAMLRIKDGKMSENFETSRDIAVIETR